MSKKKTAVLILFLFVLALFETGYAEEKTGIQVYPGATQDAETTKFLQDSLKVKGTAYRTSENAAKVIDFYNSQKDLRVISISTKKESAMFKKGDKINVTIQNPFTDMKTGKKINDTLISIVSEE